VEKTKWEKEWGGKRRKIILYREGKTYYPQRLILKQ